MLHYGEKGKFICLKVYFNRRHDHLRCTHFNCDFILCDTYFINCVYCYTKFWQNCEENMVVSILQSLKAINSEKES